MSLLKTELPKIPNHYLNITNLEILQHFHDDLRRLIQRTGSKYVAFDTETTGLTRADEVFGVSIFVEDDTESGLPGRCYWFRWDNLDEDVPEDMQLLRLFKEEIKFLFSQQEIGIIMHNGKFDIRLMRQTWPDIPFECKKYNDTMLMAQVLKFKHSSAALKELGSKLLNFKDHWAIYINQWFDSQKIKKDEKCYNEVPELIMFPYACADVELTYKLFFVLREDFKEFSESLEKIYLLERQVCPVTSSMEFYGMPVNIEYLEDLKTKLTSLLSTWMAEFKELWGKDFNPSSNQQKAEILYGKDETKNQLSLPMLRTTAGGNGSVSSETLEELEKWCEINRPNTTTALLMSKLANYGRIEHLLNNFVEGILSRVIKYGGELDYHETNPTIHTSYNQVIATGRFSSSDINLQNIPNDAFSRTKGLLEPNRIISIRRAFVCPEQYAYLKFDYAAFELRILGNAAKDKRFIAMVQEGVDMHSWLAKKLYAHELYEMKKNNDFTVDQWEDWNVKSLSDLSQRWDLTWEYWAVKSKATPRLQYMRNMVKICSFEIYYGAGAAKIAASHHIKEEEARMLKEICFSTFPIVNDWRQKVNSYAQHTNRVNTLFGRIIALEPARIYTQAVNAVIQGTAADILKYALLDMHKIIKEKATHPGTRLIATIHDEIQVLVHENDFGLTDLFIQAMEARRLPVENFPLEMLCEASYTFTNWAEMKDLHKTVEDYAQSLANHYIDFKGVN